jgi:hypothetical protein
MNILLNEMEDFFQVLPVFVKNMSPTECPFLSYEGNIPLASYILPFCLFL